MQRATTARHQSASPSSARQRVAIERAPLHDVLAHVREHLARFLGEPGGGVEQSLLVAQRRVDGASGCVLIRVESRSPAHE